jgi:hypothetical protein
MQFARKRPFTAKQSINRALRLWVFLSSARQEGLGGVRPGVNYNGKQPQGHNMSTTSCHKVTLGMLLREADVHEKNGKRQEATKIRWWVADLLSEQSKVISSVWRKRGVIQYQ